MLSSIALTVVLSFHFSPFCIHPYPAFIPIASYFFSFVRPFIFLRSTLSPSPSAWPRVCLGVCVCVAAGWLFFRQQPRRLDCHNLWSWVISVSNPNLGTGLFFSLFLFSTSFLFCSFSPSSLSFISHLSFFLLYLLNMHCYSFSPFTPNAEYRRPPMGSCRIVCTEFVIYQCHLSGYHIKIQYHCGYGSCWIIEAITHSVLNGMTREGRCLSKLF